MPRKSIGESENSGSSVSRSVTLKDVAQEAGVSISTASRVLDDRGPKTNSVAADRVRQAARDLGYRRNLFASGLRRGESGTMGVLVPRLSDQVMALMYEALERAARVRNVFTVVATCGDDPVNEERTVQTLLDRGVDGIVPRLPGWTTHWPRCFGRPRFGTSWYCAPTASARRRSATTRPVATWRCGTCLTWASPDRLRGRS